MGATALREPPAKRGSPVSDTELDMFRVFAICFGQPSHDSFSWLSGTAARSLWKRLGQRLQVKVNLSHANGFAGYETYEAGYIALFEVGVPEPPVPLLESAHSSRAVPQEIVLDCVNFYDVLGLRPSGSAFPPDHLVTQLEFLAAVRYLREQQSHSHGAEPLRCLERDFIERHLLNWLPTVQQKIDQVNPPLFPMLLRLLVAHLKAEISMLAPGEIG
jgi:DMSO reductase family type II enzyme chaperone